MPLPQDSRKLPEQARSHDVVQRPEHYTFSGIEVIDAIEAWELGFHLGNVVKYVARAGRKGSRVEDSQEGALVSRSRNRPAQRGGKHVRLRKPLLHYTSPKESLQ